MQKPVMMRPAHEPAPAIAVDGLTNFRDACGFDAGDGSRLRGGHVFRSDSLADLSDSASAVITALEIGHIIDVRSDFEVEAHGRFVPADGEAITWRQLTLGEPPVDMRAMLEAGQDPMPAMYRSMTTTKGDVLVDVLETIADASAPVVVHCTSGKDRTGVAIAVLHRTLGVHDHAIEAEYLASNQNREQHLAEMERRYPDMATMIPSSARPRMAGADSEWLDAAMQPIDSMGGIEPWLEAHGAMPDLVDRLKARLLD